MSRFRTSRRLALAIVGALMLTSLASTAVSAAPRPLTAFAIIGDYCVFGDAKPNASIKVVIRDSSGAEKGRDVQAVSPEGQWQACLGFSNALIEPGDHIKALVFETGQTRTFTIPLITLSSNRVTDVVSGKGPAGAQLTLEAYDFGWSAFGMDDFDVTQDVTVSGAGTYSYDFGNSGIDLKGGASIAGIWTGGNGNVHVARVGSVPFIGVRLGTSNFTGAARSGQHLAITLKQGSTEVAQGHAVGAYGPGDGFGFVGISGRFFDSDGEMYRVAGGEQLKAPALGSDGHFQVPAINGHVNLASDRVSGTCLPNGTFIVFVSSSTAFGYDFGTAAGDGTFSIDMTNSAGDITRGADIDILCLTESRDQIEQVFTAN